MSIYVEPEDGDPVVVYADLINNEIFCPSLDMNELLSLEGAIHEELGKILAAPFEAEIPTGESDLLNQSAQVVEDSRQMAKQKMEENAL